MPPEPNPLNPNDAVSEEAVSEEKAIIPDPGPPGGSVPGWRRFLQGQRENLRVLAIALVLALIMRVFVAEPRFIPSNSMEPTLHIGDRLIVEKLAYRLHDPQPGDIVVFRPPVQLYPYGYSAKQAFIKRVIATPGQTVQVTGQQVYINDVPQTEPYIRAAPEYDMVPITVPPESIFVLGDNRNDSNDSHVWGVLPQSHIIGRAALRFWPLTAWQWFM
ncbi:signal peptidase I [Leptolyngbya sp. PCC 6406]|uniref:signal peptidase I n=1 Tax=Leptolyngbya sp. PCC 6406 TaxID=1173264 RepID=UPI0002ACBD5F|nr:signal peptidase I [Leptolyngbya sp. PCC 6406]